jgi:bifunctional non-homologous end joining protein LigD
MARPPAEQPRPPAAQNDWSDLPHLAPMLAAPGNLPPPATDDQFGYEVKWDGIRAVAYVNGGRLRLLSRNDHDVTPAYPELAAPSALDTHTIVLDGEVVAFDQVGKPSFATLQTRMHLRDLAQVARQRDINPVTFVVFDVMHLDGRDLTGFGYRDRREVLCSLNIEATADAWTCPDYQVGHGADLFNATLRLGLEGVIAKRLESRYRPGRRSPDWIKVKHIRTQEVVIGGWTPGDGRRSETLGALLLGVPVGVPGNSGLEYVGHVGTGFTDRALADLRVRLDAVAAERSPFTGRMPNAAAAGARWVRPVIVGEVTYTDRTQGGMLRTPSWRGLRPDKSPGEIRAED